MSNLDQLYFGCHVSIRHGYLGAAKNALSVGAQSFQYFPKNPRNIGVKQFDLADAKACAQFCRENNLQSIAHTPYPTEIALEDQTLRQQMILSIINDLEIAEACGSIGVVVHFGKYKGINPLDGYKLMIETLNQVFTKYNGKARILLENNAGQGGRIGITLEELVKVRGLTQFPEKIGFCLDTCHAFASGLWTGKNTKEFLNHGEKLGYFPHLMAIHLNDSMYPARSFRDRHANIGRGHIDVKYMKKLLEIPYVKEIPIVLETPTSNIYSHKDELLFLQQVMNEKVTV